MFLCRVVVGVLTKQHFCWSESCCLTLGESCLGKKEYRKPVPKPNNTNVFYESFVNDLDDPSIFVALKDGQYYPQFLITFTEKDDSNSEPKNVAGQKQSMCG